MKGDILVINENHKKASAKLAPLILPLINEKEGKFFISVAGESGAGKSEITASLAEQLEKNGISCIIFQQDDYFVCPPKTNLKKRMEDINWVGINEVKLDLIDQELNEIRSGQNIIKKPLVNFDDDVIESEEVDVTNKKVILIEGTYTTSLKNLDCRVFIDRNYHDTKESRMERNREKQDEFLDKILLIEHEIISKHKSIADYIITKNYDVEKGS